MNFLTLLKTYFSERGSTSALMIHVDFTTVHALAIERRLSFIVNHSLVKRLKGLLFDLVGK